MPRQPSVVDKYFGARFSAARLEAGKSQTRLAEPSASPSSNYRSTRTARTHFRGHAP